MKGTDIRDADGNYTNPLEWWRVKESENQIFIVAWVAQAYLSIPATSAPSERIWSIAAQILTAKRARLSEDVTSGIMFVKQNLEVLRKHYPTLTKKMEDALPLELSGLPDLDEKVLACIDAGQDLFTMNF